MKKFLVIALSLVSVCAFGQPEILAPIVCSGVTTSTTAVTASSPVMSGYINALKIVVSDSKACDVTISDGLSTLYTATAATGTLIVYPVVQASTNAVATGGFVKPFLASSALSVSAHTITTSNSASVTVTAVIERQP